MNGGAKGNPKVSSQDVSNWTRGVRFSLVSFSDRVNTFNFAHELQ